MSAFEMMSAAAMPQVMVALVGGLVLISDLVLGKPAEKFSYGLGCVGVLLALIVSMAQMGSHTTTLWSAQWASSELSQLATVGILFTVLLVLVYAWSYLKMCQMPVIDIAILMLFSTVGMLVLVGANTLLTSYLGLEILSLPLYALTAVRRTSGDGAEAAVKYFVMGAIASGLLLYGFSLLYGVTGQFEFSAIAGQLSHQADSHFLVMMALVLILAGIGFKLAIVPFHMWVPDVYEGAPLAVTLLISSAPKIAGLVLLIRLLTIALPVAVVPWQEMIFVMAILSLVLGNVCAVVQTNLRRLFAYSAIAHMGFVLLGVWGANAEGYASAIYYLFVYMLMTVAAFGVLALLSRDGADLMDVSDLRGLGARSPWAAGLLMVVLFSMAGVPPTAGFFIKLSVLQSLLHTQHVGVAVFAVLMAVIGAFYYLRVIKVMYFDDVVPELGTVSLGGKFVQSVFSINCLSLLYFGIFPASLISICSSVFVGA